MVTAHNKKSPINKTKLQLFGAIVTLQFYTHRHTHKPWTLHYKFSSTAIQIYPFILTMCQWINTDSNRFTYIAYLFIMAKYRLRTDLLTWHICLLWLIIDSAQICLHGLSVYCGWMSYLGRKATFRTIGHKANLQEAIVFNNMNNHDFQEGTNLGL